MSNPYSLKPQYSSPPAMYSLYSQQHSDNLIIMKSFNAGGNPRSTVNTNYTLIYASWSHAIGHSHFFGFWVLV